ncbi:RNA polymerase sigma-70 factor (ECF subfamily) [Rathayibacter sp. PhB151]|uniref:sigma-70 family RNA polymerase sigma factor n=1 Tax=Rathayibacter sp. PhB151 TaxID=2485189 RepID=UPI0010628827|nr:sigma-70 family RNA polymerase sigma factor [Rathayibacter sp. PhB151]TDX79121.1 RNA polymerase sigma-70 factor (ECF subfamily) [Rathayibacter sp. PhB151]
MTDDDAAELCALISRVADGDHRAFARFYDLTIRDVLTVVVSVLRDRSLAQEVTQEVYREVWRQARRLDPARAPHHLLRQMAKRRAIDRIRSVQSDRVRDHEYALRSQESPYDQPAENSEIRLSYAPVAEAIRQLPRIHHDVLFLAYVRGYSHTQIAEELQLPLGTVKSRLRDTLHRLRRQNPGHGDGPCVPCRPHTTGGA